MLNANLKEIKNLLERTHYTCEFINQSDKFPIDQLLVTLNQDTQGRARLLVIRATHQDLSTQDALLGITSKARNYQELQFIVSLPFLVADERIPDVARLILILNKGMELTGFELSEVDHLIFFRHAFVVPEDDLDERILLSLVGMIEVLIEAFTETLETVATRADQLHEVLENIQSRV